MKKFLTGVRGKQILVSCLAVLVLVAGYFRWASDQKTETVAVVNETLPKEAEKKEAEVPKDISQDTEKEDNDFFSKARYERDCARSEATELLMVSSEEGEADVAVAEQIAQYAKNIEDEAAIETMVKAKGFDDCVAFVDATGVKIVVKSDNLEKDGVCKIKDIVIGQTGVKATEIKISGRKQ